MVTRERKKWRDEEDEMSTESDETNYEMKEAMRKARGKIPRLRPRRKNKRANTHTNQRGFIVSGSTVVLLCFAFLNHEPWRPF